MLDHFKITMQQTEILASSPNRFRAVWFYLAGYFYSRASPRQKKVDGQNLYLHTNPNELHLLHFAVSSLRQVLPNSFPLIRNTAHPVPQVLKLYSHLRQWGNVLIYALVDDHSG
jgi:hypothetical protein